MKALRTISLTLSASNRLDKALLSALAEAGESVILSRARVQALIHDGCVVLQQSEKSSVIEDVNYRARTGETYILTLPRVEAAKPEAQKIPLDVVYEDKDLLVINKAAGMVVHPAAGNHDHTLVNALLAHCGKSLSGIGGVARPGIVHRLDKDTSGLMVVAKNDAAHQALSSQFADRSLGRVYHALVWGVPYPWKGDIEGAIGRHPKDRKKMAVVRRGGKNALTHYEVKEVYGSLASLVMCKLQTGRTHQIRVHMSSQKHPLVGDPVYSGGRLGSALGLAPLMKMLEAFPRQALHAGEIHFLHPRTGKKMRFKAPVPADMAALLKKLKKIRLEE